MCGITGALNLSANTSIKQEDLLGMLSMIRHRGPDGIGIYLDERVGLGSARLSIIDLEGGDQPISNEDGTLWVIFNGEIFNYVELVPELEARGHRFSTRSDTEVLLHLYEEYGSGFLQHLNGQFAIALWDSTRRTLLLARDRVGIRPLFYTVHDGKLIFGSEVKALAAFPGIQLEMDPQALAQTFTFWSVQTPATIFKNVLELPPGHFLIVQDGEISLHSYWQLDFSEDLPARSSESYLDELESLLIDSTRIRLRSDVPVGAYLSGGLDSSIIAALIKQIAPGRLDTFSIAFRDPAFDESCYQRGMADFLGTSHQVLTSEYEDIGRVFPQVIWHVETPILRTAPAPMYMLAQRVHEQGYKVVLTGEGADELLAGYDIFKEMKIRRFWSRNPDSKIRPLLLSRLYPEINGLGGANNAFLTAFFKRHLLETDSPYYSHLLRWNNSGRNRRFLKDSFEPQPGTVSLPEAFSSWSALSQAQYLEIQTFLSQYLLSSQGDRPAMSSSVEGRYPFLDVRVMEFCARLPAHLKLFGLTEKLLLRRLGKKILPETIWSRRKRPYRAPVHRSFFSADGITPEYVNERLSSEALEEAGLFHAASVSQLVHKACSGRPISEVEDMALVGILSAQLVYQQFVKDFQKPHKVSGPAGKMIIRSTMS